MPNYDLIFLAIFAFLLVLVMLPNRKKIEFQSILFPLMYFAMYKTKLGLKFMDSFGNKLKPIIKYVDYFVIAVTFIGMAVFVLLLVYSSYLHFFQGAPPAVAPLLPGVETVPGVPVISFWHWIIAIFILAVVHEGFHGVFSRAHNVDVKSSGFAIFGIVLPLIPAAFVEPDEKQLAKKSRRTQLSVFGAGAFANIILGILIFILWINLIPIASQVAPNTNIIINKVFENTPAFKSGMKENEQLLSIDDDQITNTKSFSEKLQKIKPGDELLIVTDKSNYVVTAGNHPDNNSKAYIGIASSAKDFDPGLQAKYGKFLLQLVIWISQLVFWIWVTNIGVGLFNLIPLGPIDGGRMFKVATTSIFGNEKGQKVWATTSIALLILLIAIFAPYLLRLFNWLISPFT